MKKNNMDGGEVRITVRLPAALHQALVDEAENQDRSLNNQIVNSLRQVFPHTKTSSAKRSSGESGDEKAQASE